MNLKKLNKNPGIYADRIMDVLVDFPNDTLAQRREVLLVLLDFAGEVTGETIEHVMRAATLHATTPPKGDVLGTFTREHGIRP